MSHTKLDCRDMVGTAPLLKVKRYLDADRPEKLDILVDSLSISDSISRMLAKLGYEVDSAQEAGIWYISGSLSENAEDNLEQPIAEEAVQTVFAPNDGRSLLLIATDTLGDGAAELGTNLLLEALEGLAPHINSTWDIALLNSGVRLSTGGRGLEALITCEKNGAKIFADANSIVFYGIAASRCIGTKISMQDIILMAANATKLIRL